jgi:hypothetical protein
VTSKPKSYQLFIMSLPPSTKQPAAAAADGKQSVLGKRLTPEDGLAELQQTKLKGRLPCWKHLLPKLKPIDSKQPEKVCAEGKVLGKA